MVIDTINDIIKLGNPQFGKIKMRKDEMKNNYPDISKIKKYYNWSPKTNIKLGLKRLFHFMKISKQPLVSIIMNCHNGEKYLKESIKSVLVQNYKNWGINFF